jgi:PHD/YefM family antitoxin component YafN of YafNO toxin-antitoxin module
METVKVGIREFRENLAGYLLESSSPIAITRHGDTVGYYIPARRGRTEADRDSLREAASRMQSMMASLGITEDEVIDAYKTTRATRRGGRA